MAILIALGFAFIIVILVGALTAKPSKASHNLLEDGTLDPIDAHMKGLAKRRGLTRHGEAPIRWAGADFDGASISMNRDEEGLVLVVELGERCLLAQISLKEKPRSRRSAQEQAGDIALGITSFDERFLVQGQPDTILASLDDDARKTWRRLTAPPSAPEALAIEEGHLHARWDSALSHSIIELDAWLNRLGELIKQTRHEAREVPAILLHAAQQEHQDSDKRHSYAQRCGEALLQQHPQSLEAVTWAELLEERERQLALKAQRAQDARLLGKQRLGAGELLRLVMLDWCNKLGVEPPTVGADQKLNDTSSILEAHINGCKLRLETSVSLIDRSIHAQLELHPPQLDKSLELTANVDANAREQLFASWTALDAVNPQRVRLFKRGAWSASDQRVALLNLSAQSRSLLDDLVLDRAAELTEGSVRQGVIKLEYKQLEPLNHQVNSEWIEPLRSLCASLSTLAPEPADAPLVQLIIERASITAMHQLYLDDAPTLWETLKTHGFNDTSEVTALRALSPHQDLKPKDHIQRRQALLEDVSEDGLIRAAALKTLIQDAQISHAHEIAQAIIKAALNSQDPHTRQYIVTLATGVDQDTPQSAAMWRLLRSPSQLPSADELERETHWSAAIRRSLTEDRDDEARLARLEQLATLMTSRPLAKLVTELAMSRDYAPLTMKAEDLMLKHYSSYEMVPKMLLVRRHPRSLESDWARTVEVLRAHHSPSEDAATLFVGAARYATLTVALQGVEALSAEHPIGEQLLAELLKIFSTRKEVALLNAALELYCQHYPTHQTTFNALCLACEHLPATKQKQHWADQALDHPIKDKTALWDVLASWAIEHHDEDAGEYSLKTLRRHAAETPQLRRVLCALVTTHDDPDKRIWCLLKLGPFAIKPGIELLEQRGFSEEHKLEALELLWARSEAHKELIESLPQILKRSGLSLLNYIIERYKEGEQMLLGVLLQRFAQEMEPAHTDAILDVFMITKPAQAQESIIEKLKQSHELSRQLKWIEALAMLGVARTSVPALMDYESELSRLGDGALKEAIAQAIATLQGRVGQDAHQSLEVIDGAIASVGSLSVKDQPEGAHRGDLKLTK